MEEYAGRFRTLTFFVLIVVIVRNVTCLVCDDVVWYSVCQHVPDARSSSLGFYSALDLVCSSGNAIPKILWEFPRLVFELLRHLLARREWWVVERWWWDE